MREEDIERAAKNVYHEPRKKMSAMSKRRLAVKAFAELASELKQQWLEVLGTRARASGVSGDLAVWKEDEIREHLLQLATYYKLLKLTLDVRIRLDNTHGIDKVEYPYERRKPRKSAKAKNQERLP